MEKNSTTAVSVRNASKAYGKKPVLDKLNMHVEKGIIYGLLGASGCGKTTLLSCIVGRKSLDSGTVWVLGGPPGSSESGIPGPRVGYMPQEVALVAEFTVKAAIYYFGRIFFMSDKEIEKKFKYLTNLLDLPPPDSIITNCSGGQQRRVSFAAALVCNPELLILDEPTVGLDPVLREKIWDYLVDLTNNHKASVIITTHYIEETRQAHKIGLMRGGKLLAEESPQNLLNKFRTNSLEDVFLVLSKEQSHGAYMETDIDRVMDSNMIGYNSSTEVATTEFNHSQEILTPKAEKSSAKKARTANGFSLNGHRLKALFGKSWLQISRNYSGVGFMFVFPIFEILAFFLAVGDNVKQIKIATINHENQFRPCENYMQNMSAIPTDDSSCQFEQLGCRFLNYLHHPMIEPILYDDINKAHEAIRRGDVGGVLYIPENFTSCFQEKLIEADFESETLNNSQIQVWMDMSNYQIGMVVKTKLTELMMDFQKSLFMDCKFSSRAVANPINFDEPIYGHKNDTFMVFMSPGVIITIIYFLGTSNAASIMITDRLEGIWDRSIVAGVSSLEIVFSHFVTQFVVMTIQAAILLVFAFPVCKTQYVGSFVVIIIIVILEGVTGIAFGFLVSVVSNSHSMANIVATGSFYPMLVLCGMMWPLEGMPKVLQWIALLLPFTLPIDSLRNVIIKGWGILHKDVLTGIGVQLIWTAFLGLICLLELKRQR